MLYRNYIHINTTVTLHNNDIVFVIYMWYVCEVVLAQCVYLCVYVYVYLSLSLCLHIHNDFIWMSYGIPKDILWSS